MSSNDDLQFLTSTDMDDEYNETAPRGPMHYDKASDHLGQDDGAAGSTLKRFGFFTESRHPGAACFHLLFKTLALVVYETSGWFTSNFVLVCVMCILLLAFDFWTVKNVSGRLLVGLRWWNYVKEDGATEWVFESTEDMSEIGATDRRLFWVGLYSPAVAWSVLLFLAIVQFKVQWLIVIFAALSLSAANIVGYTKCSKEAQQRLQNLRDVGVAGGAAQYGVAQNLVSSIGVSNILSGLGSFVSGGGNVGNAAQVAAGMMSV